MKAAVNIVIFWGFVCLARRSRGVSVGVRMAYERTESFSCTTYRQVYVDAGEHDCALWCTQTAARCPDLCVGFMMTSPDECALCLHCASDIYQGELISGVGYDYRIDQQIQTDLYGHIPMNEIGESTDRYIVQPQNGPVVVPGLSDSAIKMLGTSPKLPVNWNASLECPMNITYCEESGLSLSFWMKFSDILPATYGWTEMFTFSVDGFKFATYRGLHAPTYNRINVYARDGHNTSSHWYMSRTFYPHNWYLIAVSWSRDSGLRVYINEGVTSPSPTTTDDSVDGTYETKFAAQGRDWTIFDDFYLWAREKPARFFKRLYEDKL